MSVLVLALHEFLSVEFGLEGRDRRLSWWFPGDRDRLYDEQVGQDNTLDFEIWQTVL